MQNYKHVPMFKMSTLCTPRRLDAQDGGGLATEGQLVCCEPIHVGSERELRDELERIAAALDPSVSVLLSSAFMLCLVVPCSCRTGKVGVLTLSGVVTSQQGA